MNELNQGVVPDATSPNLKTGSGYFKKAVLFCALTLGFSWIIWIYVSTLNASPTESALPILTTAFTTRGILLIVGNLIPGIVAITLSQVYKHQEPRKFLDQFRLGGCTADVYIFAILCPIGIYLLVLCIESGVSAVRELKLLDYVRFMATNVLLVPLWEELGWRGFLYRCLLRMTSVRKAMLLVGVIWAAWHFPLYCLIWRVSAPSYLVSFLTLIALSLVLSLLFSISKESVVLPAIFHASWNAAGSVVARVQPNYHLRTAMIEVVAICFAVAVTWWSFADDISSQLSTSDPNS